jgi:hypothetical protein
VRDHSRTAGEHVERFCKRSTDVVSTIRALQQHLEHGATNGSG